MSELVATWGGYEVRRQAGGWPGAGPGKRPYAVWLTGPQTLLRTERDRVRTFATPAAARRAGLAHLRAGWNQRQTLRWERDQYGHYNAADEGGNRYQARRRRPRPPQPLAPARGRHHRRHRAQPAHRQGRGPAHRPGRHGGAGVRRGPGRPGPPHARFEQELNQPHTGDYDTGMGTKRKRPTDADHMGMARRGLAEAWLGAALAGGGVWTEADRLLAFLKLRAHRVKLFAQLQSDGYVEADGRSRGRVTSKAFDELEAERPDLAAVEAARAGDELSGGAVPWSLLTLAQRKWVVLALQTVPASYTLAYTGGLSGMVKCFDLGGADAAQAACGRHAFLVVTNSAQRAVAAARARQRHLGGLRRQGLNWYLRQVGVFGPDEEVPTASESRLHASPGALPQCPEDLAAGLPAAIAAVEQEAERVRLHLESLRKLEAAVAAAGGWTEFLAAYDAAVADYAARQWPAQPA